MSFDNLPTLAEQSSRLAFKPKPKGKSRLEQMADVKPLTVVDEKAFKKDVRARDGKTCRKCGCRVKVQMERDPRRAEIHHLHGRRGDFRFDSRFAIQVCMTCHEGLTGKVNEKWITVGTVFIDVPWKSGGVAKCIDARHPVTFERAA